MTSERTAIEVLEEKHALKILVFLLENGPCTKMDLYRAVSGNPRMPEKLSKLEGIGLVRMDRDEHSTLISLTEKGAAVGMKIEEALDITTA